MLFCCCGGGGTYKHRLLSQEINQLSRLKLVRKVECPYTADTGTRWVVGLLSVNLKRIFKKWLEFSKPNLTFAEEIKTEYTLDFFNLLNTGID